MRDSGWVRKYESPVPLTGMENTLNPGVLLTTETVADLVALVTGLNVTVNVPLAPGRSTAGNCVRSIRKLDTYNPSSCTAIPLNAPPP